MTIRRVCGLLNLIGTILQPGHDTDTPHEPSAPADDLPLQATTGADPTQPPNPLTVCPICGETLICRDAALEWTADD